jgi:predicted ATPase
LSGEAGIGKSRLVQVLKDHVADASHTRLECRSLPYFTNSALYPIIDMVQRTLRFQTDDTPEQKLEKLTQNLSQYRLPVEETVPLFGALLSLPVPEEQYPPLSWTPQRQRQKTLEAIVAIMLELAEQQPVLFILEDLHWTDPTTLEFIELLIDQTPTASLYVLLTCRPEFQPSWSHRSYLTEITVNRLSRDQIEQVATQVAGGKMLPVEIIEQLVDKTDGVPLYVEEMTKAMLESGHLKVTNEHYELTGTVASLAIPATLQDSLMARLDRLMTAKVIAQLGAVLGRTFTYDLLQAVSPVDEAILQRELRQLVEAELMYQRGLPPQATYTFKHALIHDAAYQSLLKSTRQQYHQRIVQVLEARFPYTVETQPEFLAYHCTEAGLTEQAVGYWQHAGAQAMQHSANAEAIHHLTKGLEGLNTLPDTSERVQHELSVLIMLGPALIATKGYTVPEVAAVYNRAYDLCQRVGEEAQRFSVLTGLRRFYQVGGDLGTAREIGEQLLTIAQHQQDPTLLLEAYWSLSSTLFFLGEFAFVQDYLAQAMLLYEAPGGPSQTLRHGIIPGMHCLSWLSVTLWMRGYADQARHRSQEALTLAYQLSPSFSQTFVLTLAAWLHQFRREGALTQEYAEALTAVACEQAISSLLPHGIFLRGWALSVQGQREEGIEQMRQGLIPMRTGSDEVNVPFFLALLAEVYQKAGQIDTGFNTLAEALTRVEKMGTHFYEAEIHRLKGELLLQQSPDNQPEAESCFQHAITIAQHQSAKSWELRASTSLARLWRSQGKRAEARELLEPVYSWFTEGFDTADLRDAKALLDELA